jgi:hypothetical protein
MIRNQSISLGPRDVVLGGKVVSTVEDVKVFVEEATEEEIKNLQAEPVILLVKPLVFRKEETPV